MSPGRIAALVAGLALAAAGCGKPAVPEPWQVGYWYWRAAERGGPLPSSAVPDVVYVHVGSLTPAGLAQARWPAEVPPARAYFVTWRSDEARPPSEALMPAIVQAQRRLAAEAAAAGRTVRGVQLDVDCPTASLRAYAGFLGRLRGRLGDGTPLSVTALLDWFRPGTAVSRLAGSVDEYIPQFYDARPDGPGAAIAEPIDAERWRPVFERLGTRYRIGISSFGRIQRVRGGRRDAFRDARLLDLWSGLRAREPASSPSAETVLSWDVERPPSPLLEAGDRVEAVLPSAASVRAAHAAARRFGRHCAGVVHFRWPDRSETLALSPDEVTAALGEAPSPQPELRASEGGCGARACADLVLRPGGRFAAEPRVLRVRASEDVDYVMAAHRAVALRQRGPRAIDVMVPAFVGEREVVLGRVFSRRPGRYAIEGGVR